MTVSQVRSVKVTVSLPADLLAAADRHAAQLNTNRSHIIGLALAQLLAAEEERLAAQGYRFYAAEAAEFAAIGAGAVAEAIGDGG